MDHTKIKEQVFSAMDKWRETFGKKNCNYGDSWLLTGQTIDLWFPDGLELNTVRRHIMYGLITRMLDKLIRLAHLELAGVPDEVGEASSETAGDLGVYGLMASGLASAPKDTQDTIR